VSQAGNRNYQNETRTQTLDAVIDLTETGAVYEIDKETDAGGRKDDPDGSKSSFRAWWFGHAGSGEMMLAILS